MTLTRCPVGSSSGGPRGPATEGQRWEPELADNLLSFRDLMMGVLSAHRRPDNQALLFEENPYKRFSFSSNRSAVRRRRRAPDRPHGPAEPAASEDREKVREMTSLAGFLHESGTPARPRLTGAREIAAERELTRWTSADTRIAEIARGDRVCARAYELVTLKAKRLRRAAASRSAGPRTLIELLPLRGQYAEDERKLTVVARHDAVRPVARDGLPELSAETPWAPAHRRRPLHTLRAGTMGRDRCWLRRGCRAERDERAHADLDRYIDRVQEEENLARSTVAEVLGAVEERVEAELNSVVARELSPLFRHARASSAP